MSTRKKIIIVSTFSGMDLLMLAFVRAWTLPGYALEKNIWAALLHAANFKHSDGTPVIQFVNISEEEHKELKANPDNEFDSALINGQYIRGKRIEEVNGAEVRAEIERRFGSNIYVILLGGPPCQDLCKMNRQKRTGERDRNKLLFEYARFVGQLNPDIAVMEEAQELGHKQYKELFDELLALLTRLPFRVAHMEMNSTHYGSNQQRVRTVVMLVNKSLGMMPVFPEPDVVNVKRVRDFLDIDYFHSGNFTDQLKGRNHFMCTVTSGAPAYFIKNDIKRDPTVDELLLCFDVRKGEYTIPDSIPNAQVRKAIGNSVCVALFEKIANTIIEKILRVRHVGDGWFVPIESPTDNDSPTAADSPTPNSPVIPPTDTTKPSSMSSETGANTPVATNSASNQASPNNVPPANKGNSALPGEPTASSDAQNLDKIRPGTIITSEDLVAMQFTALDFNGKWKAFLGCPSNNFYCIVHGMAGEGKSTFSIQFAKYLTDNLGLGLYISAEEGISQTLQGKFLHTNSGSPSLHVVELKNFNDILRVVRAEKYRFIFIDSLQHLKIDASQMRELRARYSNSAFISISQSTKSGTMRGSAEHAHDSDIVIEVVKGLASTTKNRFLEKGKTYDVFEIMRQEVHSQVGNAEVPGDDHTDEDALLKANRAIELEPNNPRHYLNRAKILKAMGHVDQFLDDANMARRLNTSNDNALETEIKALLS